MIFSTPSGCPSAETANERMRTVLNAVRTAATDTMPTVTTSFKHPERNSLLSFRSLEGSTFQRARWPAFQLVSFLLKCWCLGVLEGQDPYARRYQYPTLCGFIHRQILYSQKHGQGHSMCRLLLVADREYIQADTCSLRHERPKGATLTNAPRCVNY